VAARKVDRWWTILIAFAVALGMVLLVMLAMGSGPSDGAATKLKPATPPTRGTFSISRCKPLIEDRRPAFMRYESPASRCSNCWHILPHSKCRACCL